MTLNRVRVIAKVILIAILFTFNKKLASFLFTNTIYSDENMDIPGTRNFSLPRLFVKYILSWNQILN